jgi:hypothetical protein
MPVPSPYASAQPKPQKSGSFAWLRGDAEPNTARAPQPSTTPAQSAATTVAMAERRTAAPGQPVAASFAPVSKDKPFYKRWLGFGGDKQATAPSAPAPQPQTAAAPAPVPAPRPSSVPVPQPQASTPPAQHGLSTPPILSTGGFQ